VLPTNAVTVRRDTRTDKLTPALLQPAMPRRSAKPPRFYKRWPVRVAAIIVVIAAITFVVILRMHSTTTPAPPQSPIPKSISSQVHIPLYYPSTLPAGLTVDKNSFRVPAPDVVVFAIQSPDGRLSVSEQAMPGPGKLNINDFLKTNVLDSVASLSTLGQVTIGHLADGTRFGSLVTGSWIIVVGPQQVTANDVRDIINAMSPVS